VAPVGMHLVKPVAAVVLKTEHDPAAIRRIGTNQCLDVATCVSSCRSLPSGRMIARFAKCRVDDRCHSW
jgi:hypothetical protein